MSRVKNRKKNATVDLSVRRTKIVVKMNHPNKYRLKEFKNGAGESASRVEMISNPPGVRTMAVPIQKPP